MSKRSRTTLTFSVRMPLPPGATAKDALAYVHSAITSWKGGMDPAEPITSLQSNEVLIKIINRETVYL